MRRTAALLLAAVALAAGGCGGGDDVPEAKSPLDEALGYLPADAPLAVVIPTDLKAIERAIPGAGPGFLSGLASAIESEDEDIDFDDHIEPLLGNELVVGGVDAKGIVKDESEGVIAAIQTKDAKTLSALLKATESKKIGEAGGATLYEAGDDTHLAVRDDILVLADSRAGLEEALEHRKSDDRLTEERFDKALEGLEPDALLRVYANLEQFLRADPDARQALEVKWIAALRTFAASISLSGKGAEVEYTLSTESGEIEDADVPVASGEEAPAVAVRPGEIGIAVRDLAHVIRFAEATGKLINPTGFAEYDRGKGQIARELGVDLDEDVIGQLTGDTTVSIGIDDTFAARAELENPGRLRRTLQRLVSRSPELFEGFGIGRPERRGNAYETSGPAGQYAFGVLGDVFAISNDPGRLRSYAAQPARQVAGAEGSVVLTADAGALVRQILGRLGSGLEQLGGALITNALGDITASIAADTNAVRGKIELQIKG